MLLLLLNTNPTPAPVPAFVNAAQLIQDLWPPLNAVSEADAVFWTAAEMFEWFNEGSRKLAGVGPFVVRDETITLSDSQALYDLPDSHLATIQADADGKVLRARTVAELEALDGNWTDTSGTPKAFVQDVEGARTIRPYPRANLANDGKTLGLVMRAVPDDVAANSAYLSASPALRDFYTFYILSQARSKECHAQMKETADWFGQLAGSYLEAIKHYMGGD